MSYRCVVPSLSSSIIITESATIKALGTRCSKRKNASAVLTGRCDVVSDWAVCSVITTAPPHRSSGAPAGRNGWSGGEVCSGAPIAEPVSRRLVSANLENASRIRAFGSVRIFGHDAQAGLRLLAALVHNSDRGRELAWPRLPSSDHLAIRHPERRHGVENLAPDPCLDSLCRQPSRSHR